jgi:large subunit ribosomal protein L25
MVNSRRLTSMKETPVIKIETRTGTSKGSTKSLRRNGYVPGIIIHKGMESIPVSVKRDEFRKCLNKFGRNSVIKLQNTDDTEYTVIVKELQTAPMVNEYVHVDFQQVSLSEKIKTDVSIRFIGLDILDSKRLLLNRQMDTIPLEGLPQNVPDELDIDVTNLKAGDHFRISDIKLPEGINFDIAPDQIVVSVSESKVHEAVEEEAAAVEAK